MNRLIFGVLSLVLVTGVSHAQGLGQVLEDIQLTKSSDTTTVQINPGCKLRYLEQLFDDSGTALLVNVLLDNECRLAIGGAINEIYRPTGRGLAFIDEVEFDTPGNGRGSIRVSFTRPVTLDVTQRVTGGLLLRVKDAAVTDAQNNNVVVGNLDDLPAAPTVVEAAPKPTPQRPLRLRDAPGKAEQFAVLLGVFKDAEQAVKPLLSSQNQTVYTTQLQVSGQVWQGLHIGFFASESEAQQAVRALKPTYPDAWVVVVSASDFAKAQENQLALNRRDTGPKTVEPLLGQNLQDEELKSKMSDAKQAILQRDYSKAVDLYTQILQSENGQKQPEAREFLAVALERSGDLRRAQAEYQRTLDDHPSWSGASRVQNRLLALQTALDRPNQSLAASTNNLDEAPPVWEVFGGVAQYYRYDIAEIPSDRGEVDKLSGVTTYGDFAIARHGERFELAGRVNSAYLYDTLDEEENFGNRGWVSHAYLDVTDKRLNIDARLGRQTRTGSGVLGRFDGLHVGYQWKPRIRVNLTTGYPVESPRYQPNTRRFFYGSSVDFTGIWDRWDFTVYTHQQTVDGIDDRRAVGGEAYFTTDRWNVISLVDYDLSYGVLNSALLSAHRRFGEETVVSTTLDFGAQPYLITQNALSGQPVATIDDLLTLYTEGQIRTLARNRTAQVYRASLGLSRSLGPRLKLNTDLSYTQAEETPASGGVAARPETGAQIFYTATLTRNGLLTSRDLSLITVRYNTTRTFTDMTLGFDARYPIGSGFRFNPRLFVTQRDNQLDTTTQLIANASVRLLFRWAQRFLLEFEAGAQFSDRDIDINSVDSFFPGGSEEVLGNYFNIGYRAEF